MERPMANWNDERLDELSRRMDEGFKEMRESFKEIRAEMVTRDELRELIAAINSRFDQVDRRFERLENRVDRLYYGCVALLVFLVGNTILSVWV